MRIRKLTNGYEIGNCRFFFRRHTWVSKPRPYWFARRYPGGIVTVQSGPFEFFKR